jgi:phosphonate transport system permease protein
LIGSADAAGAPDVVARFEAERARALSRARMESALWIVGLSALLWGATHFSGIGEQTIGEGPLSRIAGFLGQLNPNLRPEALFDGPDRAGSLAHWFYDLPRWVAAAFETLQMAALATCFGAVGAVLLATLASRTTMRFGVVRFAARRLFEILRTIPDIILATILVAALGVGPLAGMISLTLSTMGSLGKLFTEANENVDVRIFDGVRAAGGSWAHEIRFGLAPQVAPNYASYALIRLEINLAAAAALGIVGAGGIGIELQRAISFLQYDTYLAILLIMLVLIMSCDLASEAIRRRLTGKDVHG